MNNSRSGKFLMNSEARLNYLPTFAGITNSEILDTALRSFQNRTRQFDEYFNLLTYWTLHKAGAFLI